jgi:LacI family transcriptional regulator, repressor for deo operon, udp, cdd, tsx, nupC, and nupG
MSILNVARQAGVSIATVSRAFNAPESVAPATRAAVAAAAAALGYEPNLSARTLRTQRSRTLGVVLPTLRNPVFAETLAGIAGAAADAGYSIIPLTTDYQEAQELEALRLLSRRSVDGLILTVADAARSATLASLKRARRPYVLAYNRHAQHPCVSVDGKTAMAELVARLQQLGHRRILMVSGHLSASDRAQQRHCGYAAAMQASGSTAELLELPFMETAPELLTQRLGRADRPSALVCSNDLLALRCMRAAALAGLRVPEDLSVIGFDGIALGTELRPSLASISQPNEGIGRRSVAWLLDCLDRGSAPRAADSLTLPHQLRELESMSAPSSSIL